jgi:murein DD-endopeptidase MepM/ murein hydrolase activator NlpD
MLRFPLDPASDCYVLDNFGDCRDGCSRFHEGVDIMGSKGQPVYAVADGLLKQRYTNTGTAGWGWTLVDEDNDVTYRYFHCDEDANGLIEGDRVSEGDVIGYVGKSGTFGVDNYHLHFEVRPGGTAIDPLPLLFIDTDVCDVSEPIKG